jgi:hypothetical protein
MVAFLLALALQAEDAWRAGVAEVKITPEAPVHLSGYASRNRPFEKVATDLYAKALALEDAGGRRAVLVTTDLTGFRRDVAEPLCERIAEKTGLRREQILLNSSHTHSGPVLTLNPGARGNLTAEEAAKCVAYTRWMQDRVFEAAAGAVAKLEPARLAWGRGKVDFVMNRRQRVQGKIVLGTNPDGPVDRTVPVLRVTSPEGKLRAVVFGAACHNTTLTSENYELCGDYAGFAQKTIGERHSGAVAMFVLGCAGDANPHPRGTMEAARRHGDALADEVGRVLGGALAPVAGPLRAAFERVDLPLRPPPPREELVNMLETSPVWQHDAVRRMLSRMDRGEELPKAYSAPVAVWQFGRDLTFVGLSGEVVVDYVRLIEDALGRPERLWIAAYCNDKFGYFPSKRVLEEGGYEAQGLADAGPGFFAPEAQDVLLRTVKAMTK